MSAKSPQKRENINLLQSNRLLLRLAKYDIVITNYATVMYELCERKTVKVDKVWLGAEDSSSEEDKGKKEEEEEEEDRTKNKLVVRIVTVRTFLCLIVISSALRKAEVGAREDRLGAHHSRRGARHQESRVAPDEGMLSAVEHQPLVSDRHTDPQ